MFKIVKGNLFITKGDTGAFYVKMTKKSDGAEYILREGDKLTLTVREQVGSPVLLRAESTTNNIRMNPSDTKNLEVGTCVYDIQLDTAEGDVFTIVGLTDESERNMTVYPEVTE